MMQHVSTNGPFVEEWLLDDDVPIVDTKIDAVHPAQNGIKRID